MSKWFQNKRQEFIANVVAWGGNLNRDDLVRAFDISKQQASHDIQVFLDRNPGQLEYDASGKRYRATGNRP